MSLVSYYSSSDDEKSSNEEETEDKSAVAKVIRDRSPADESSGSSLFSTLPAPKPRQINEPEELDVKHPIASSSTASKNSSPHGLLNLPAPKKRSTQPIKITAPSLPETNSDDEEDEPLTKKAKQAKGLAGLFALLPKPKNASLKETNRILLPHTLTKKPASSKPAKKPPVSKPNLPSQPGSGKSKPSAVLATSYGSDDEEEDDTVTSSFFSFGESSKTASRKPEPGPDSQPLSTVLNKLSAGLPSVKPTPTVVSQATSQPKPQPAIPERSQFGSTAPPTFGPSVSQDAPLSFGPSTSQDAPLSFGPSPSQDAPLAFKPSDQAPSSQDAPLSFSKPMHPSAQYSYHGSQYAESQTYAAPYGYDYTQYNQPYQEEDDPPVFQQGVDGGGGQSAEGLSDLAADKEFQRLMGKRNVGRESIQMVEIAADEQVGPTDHLDWMKKNLTEEKEYRAKLKKEQLPSGQQKRKHQITFLAHQAKERELELKNNWANNRQTRKQTQMKYGF